MYLYYCLFFVYFLLSFVSLFVSSSAFDFLERPVSTMTYSVWSCIDRYLVYYAVGQMQLAKIVYRGIK